MWEETNLLCRSGPSNLCRYCPFQEVEVEHNSPLLECGLLIVFSFQRGQYAKEEIKKKKEYSGETCQTLPEPGDQGQCG